MKSRITILGDLPRHYRMRLRKALRICLRKNYPRGGGLSVQIVHEDEIQAVNLEQRNIDASTDVLSFPTYARGESKQRDPEIGCAFLGDILISIAHVARQSRAYGHSELRELCYLATHGCLHLLGYDHITAAEKGVMRRREERVMHALRLLR